MADEIKNEVNEVVEPAVVEEPIVAEEPEMAADVAPQKDIDTKAIIDNIFGRKPAEGGNGDTDTSKVKRPENIFSRPIPVTQDDAARKARLKIVIIEGLLFGAFITAITAIYSFSGLELKLDPENGANTPSFWFFLLVFVFFSIAIGVGDYFLTERRVNNYNSKMAGINLDSEIDNEIEKALAAQEAEGITAEDAAAMNNSNGEEKPLIDIRCTEGEESLTDKVFEAYINDKRVGFIKSCKGIILDSNGFETPILKVCSLSVNDGDFKNGVVMELIAGLKKSASDNTLAAVAIPKSVYGDLVLNVSGAEKFGITYGEELKIQEAYPGALMGIKGELK